MSDTIFVTGASGQLGQLVIKHLLARGVTPNRIIAGTRSPEKLADLAAAGIEVRQADFEDLQGLAEAFKGVGTALIVSTDAVDGADRRLKQHRNAVLSAAEAGVKRLAYTSMPNPASSLLTFARDHPETERTIQATGLPHVIFRNGWYHENLLRSLPDALKNGQWYSATADGRTSSAGREEMAEAIAAALATSTSESRTYTLTGTEALSSEEIADLVRRATGKPLAVVHVTDEQFATGLKAAGVPDGFVSLLVSIEAEVRAGNLSIVTDHLESLIGRTPKRLADYLQEAKASYAV
ncbi:SDR family oxidoreductase [Paraburkholderia fungorum]|uniref:NAD(P)H dehydrogenase (Quinone) n=1 Tax=Paraburkholderia fungorum TaxID=134537 RepID=A0AAW3USQ1_9BURK|nr:SDR family oxidoreductase [Paraburkholderia fungorum]MBB4513217.1 NAD(P)H dehydrogenase (quinone) [Paraburkholderia fungorum]MBB6201356.1 NAD(P)H dehydrogenase (quinone) [Paraburkholderia fungorum]